MRLFLIIFNFINLILYYTAFAYFDNIASALVYYNVSAGFLSFLKFIIILILGFMIGLLIAISIKQVKNKNYFDLKTFLIAGSIPAIALIAYKTGLVDAAVSNIFNSSLTISELAFYFFSRETVWAIWLGVSIGASVRLRFGTSDKNKRFKHQVLD